MIEPRRHRSWWHIGKPAFFTIDYALFWLAVQIASNLSPWAAAGTPPGQTFVVYGLPLAAAVGLQIAGVQVVQAGSRGSETLARVLVGSMAGMAGFVVLNAVVGYTLIGRYILGLTLLNGVVLVMLSRQIIWRFAERESREVYFLGSESIYRELTRLIAAYRLPIRLVGRGPADDESGSAVTHVPASEQHTAEIVVENPDTLAPVERQRLLSLMSHGRQIIDLSYFYESEFEMVYVAGLRPSWFWSYDPAHVRPVYFTFKRVIDVSLSTLGLLVTAPFSVLAALGIVLQDRGPVIYSQTRVGLRNRPFRIYKFRTMRTDAEPDGAQWATENDGRVTPVGRILRRTRLDEIPQFWNILKGEMSFVGPRPERPEIIERIEAALPYYRFRHIVKPGLTGWAQVNFPYGASIEDVAAKLAYDLYSIKYGSITRDLYIVLRSVVATVRGAR